MLDRLLQDSGARKLMLRLLRWSDFLALATTSVGTFSKIKAIVSSVAVDVSLGESPVPIACDGAVGKDESSKDMLMSGNDERWCLGGPVPSSFAYRNGIVYPRGVPAEAKDLLQGCSCHGACNSRHDSTGCPCVQLNAAAGR